MKEITFNLDDQVEQKPRSLITLWDFMPKGFQDVHYMTKVCYEAYNGKKNPLMMKMKH